MILFSNRLTAAVVTLAGLTIAGAATAAGPSILSVKTETNTVGLYEKFELRVDLKASYANPFDPDEIDLWADFRSPSGKAYRIWGFYNPSHWSSLWMVRFAPTETGEWKYTVNVADREGNAKSDSGRFTAVASPHHGFIGIAPNRRYFKYTDGASFYG